MTKCSRQYLRRAARAASCSPEAKKKFLQSLTRQLEALEKDDPDADDESIAASLGSPEQAVSEYEAALPESDRIMARRHRFRVRIAVAAAVFAAFAVLAVIFWQIWQTKKQPYIVSTTIIYSSEEASQTEEWNNGEMMELPSDYFEVQD